MEAMNEMELLAFVVRHGERGQEVFDQWLVHQLTQELIFACALALSFGLLAFAIYYGLRQQS